MLSLLGAQVQSLVRQLGSDKFAAWPKTKTKTKKNRKVFQFSFDSTSKQNYIYFCFIDYAKAFDSVHHNKLWKILQEMGIPDQLTCLLINLYAGQEATVRTGHGTMDWLKIGKGVMSRLYIVTLLI